MSARISPLFTWRGAIAGTNLPAPAKLVALTLSLHMSERGDSCFPSLDELRAETSLGRKTVVDSIRELEAAGLLEVTRSGPGRGRRSRYRAIVPDEMIVKFLATRPKLREKVLSDTISESVKGSDEGREKVLRGHPQRKDVKAKDVNHTSSSSLRSEELVQTPSKNGNDEGVKELWDALADEGVVAPSARSPRAAFAKLVRELHDAGWSAQDVKRRTQLYRSDETLGRCDLTVAALAKHGERLEAMRGTPGDRYQATVFGVAEEEPCYVPGPKAPLADRLAYEARQREGGA